MAKLRAVVAAPTGTHAPCAVFEARRRLRSSRRKRATRPLVIRFARLRSRLRAETEMLAIIAFFTPAPGHCRALTGGARREIQVASTESPH